MNESALFITDFSPIQQSSYQLSDNQHFEFKKLYNKSINLGADTSFYIKTSDPKSYFKQILKQVKFIKAAGGLVKNENNEYLFIKRLGKWDLPKGKLEKGEKMRETALREVEEECGIKIDVLKQKIKSTYHSYVMFDELIIKKTNWYEMEIKGRPILIPQAEEDITEAVWLKTDVFNQVRENTYPLIKELIIGM